jgi:hypothetical protein
MITKKLKMITQLLKRAIQCRMAGMTYKEIRDVLKSETGQAGLIELLISVIVLVAVMVPVVVKLVSNVTCRAVNDTACVSGTSVTMLNLLPLGLAISAIVLIFSMAKK